MKKNLLTLAAVFLLTTAINAQLYYETWSFGASFNSVRFTSDVQAEPIDFGGDVYLQYDLSKYHAIRGIVDFGLFSSTHAPVFGAANPLSTTKIGFGADYIFKFFNEGPIYPYGGAGFQLIYFDVANNSIAEGGSGSGEGVFGELGAKIFAGAMIDIIGKQWKLKAEFTSLTVSTDYFDGTIGQQGGIFGGTLDSYIQAGFGIHYYFNTDNPVMEGPVGLAAADVDYDKIDAINKKYAADSYSSQINNLQVSIERLESKIDEMVKRAPMPDQHPAMITGFKSLYFPTDNKVLTFDSYKDLVEMGEALKRNTSVNIELTGHADNTSTKDYNMTLSKKRAE
ncbi:MAG: OmpA family protein, partial [Melioribacteraceae bacterium]|nr:OmpA family protein [Melioribacteraceae bacterium]